MDNDYENSTWTDNVELCYGKRNSKRTQMRSDERLYGIFSSDNSDDDTSDYEDLLQPSKKYRKQSEENRANYSKPVIFTSGCKLIPNQLTDLNSKGGSYVKDEEVFFSTPLWKEVKEGVKRRCEIQQQKATKKNWKEEFPSSGQDDEDLGLFEMHTRQIGLKLLRKNGYVEGGLGKNGQGIKAPIEVMLRPRNVGIGFNAREETTKPELKSKEEEAVSSSGSVLVKDGNYIKDEEDFFSSALWKEIEEGVQRRRERQQKEATKKNWKEEICHSSGHHDGLGLFERHTRQIGTKLLRKNGYIEGGLGKNGQGIVAPIEVKLRPRNEGLGFNA
ncbi:OLC1v1001587C1 [Oldenlandia corymbosa var. corymbosa]|uniref:OLC1v1001587C1 n=1 Tax=Oldenlandia corymbosa var. corymbosa TaxID=529605 RepID=A0AAV1D6B6_OLDCO|nr:OLC1v1001587C1 [Oldenlandia corymbosa var. corymbosa]